MMTTIVSILMLLFVAGGGHVAGADSPEVDCVRWDSCQAAFEWQTTNEEYITGFVVTSAAWSSPFIPAQNPGTRDGALYATPAPADFEAGGATLCTWYAYNIVPVCDMPITDGVCETPKMRRAR